MAFVRIAMSGFLLACVLAMSSTAQQPQAKQDPKTYKIGTGDVLRITVRNQPDLPVVVTVRPDGMITPRLIADVQAGGLTPEEVAAKLTVAYLKLIRDPVVMVSVEEVHSKR